MLNVFIFADTANIYAISHTRVSVSRLTRATAAVIWLRKSLRLAGSEGTKTVSFTNPQNKKSHGVKSGEQSGHRINASSSFLVRPIPNFVAILIEIPSQASVDGF
jgi:hypothetical protein